MKKVPRDIIRRLIALICGVIFIVMIFKVKPIREITELLFMSFILAYALKPLHKILIKRGVNRLISSAAIIIFFITIFFSAIVLVVPTIVREGSSIVEMAGEIGKFIGSISFDTKLLEELDIMDNLMAKSGEFFEDLINAFMERSVYWLKSFKENIVKSVGIPIIAFFFLCDGEKISNKVLVMFSYKKRRVMANVIRDIDRVLTKYVFSEIILCVIISSLTYMILKVYKVEFPLLLSLLNGILNIIPYFGPPVGAVLIILVAIINENAMWGYIIFWMLASQVLEGNIISPMIIGESVNMHPMLIIILLIFGGELGGFLGMVLAIPIGVVIKVLYIDINHFLFSD